MNEERFIPYIQTIRERGAITEGYKANQKTVIKLLKKH